MNEMRKLMEAVAQSKAKQVADRIYAIYNSNDWVRQEAADSPEFYRAMIYSAADVDPTLPNPEKIDGSNFYSEIVDELENLFSPMEGLEENEQITEGRGADTLKKYYLDAFRQGKLDALNDYLDKNWNIRIEGDSEEDIIDEITFSDWDAVSGSDWKDIFAGIQKVLGAGRTPHKSS